MPIETRDLYQQAFESLRHASDFRVKIIGGWAAMYTAFTGIFAWSIDRAPGIMWVVLLAAGVMTVLMWLADYRNRPAIGLAKDIGTDIENAAASAIPMKCRFFSRLDKGVSHSNLIDAFGVISVGMLCGGAVLAYAATGLGD